jgi:plastocyanin
MASWSNTDSLVHRIVANDNSWDTGDIAPGQASRAIRVASEGVRYHCSLHPGMIGALNAAGEPPPPCTGPYCE